jgi:ribosomal protein L25 (general stress protein Ctc)
LRFLLLGTTEWGLITKIKQKLTENELIIVKVEKGRTIVILIKENQAQKVNNFIQEDPILKHE